VEGLQGHPWQYDVRLKHRGHADSEVCKGPTVLTRSAPALQVTTATTLQELS